MLIPLQTTFSRVKKKKKKMFCKNFSRVVRRIAAMVKIASVMMILIFISGILNAKMHENMQEDSPNSDVLLRHQRRQVSVKEDSRNNDVLKEQNVLVTKQLKNTADPGGSEDKHSLKTTKTNVESQINLNPDITPKQKAVSESKNPKTSQKEENLKWQRRIREKNFAEIPPNSNLIFHNKLPKSGSSTMNNILKTLSRKNHFNFMKVETTEDKTMDDVSLVVDLMTKAKKPFLLLKHHRWLDFTKSNKPQPTFINVMRDPIEWFTSRYYFSRYGWERKPGCRKADCGMTKEERSMEIDECVKKRHRECMKPWMYIQFFCGVAPECYNSTTRDQKRRATDIAKQNILDEYYAVGILEQFEDTLKMFEVLMPSYFKTAVSAWKSEFVQIKQNMTRTIYKREMSEESKKFFREGPLRYEIELYDFARDLFNERLKRLHIEPAV